MSSSILERLREAVATINGSKGFTGSIQENADRAFGLLSGVLTHGRNPPIRRRFDLLESYSRLPWLRSIVGRIGYAVSATPWELFVEVRGGEVEPIRQTMTLSELHAHPDLRIVHNRALQMAGTNAREKMVERRKDAGELVEVTDHPLLHLLQNFNPMMPGMAAFKLTQSWLDLVGEAFWLKERDALGTVIALWPITPPWVQDTPRPGKPFYEMSWNTWQVKIPETEMIWFCDNDPARPYWRGVGTASALADELETDEYAAKHTKREFFNNAVPEMLVTAEGLGEEETRRMERDWKHKNRGFFKALQIYFLNRKVDVKILGQSFKSLQLIELRKWERDIIIEVFGVPPEILGIVNESKRSTIDAADFLFSRWVLTPRLELLRSVIQDRLVVDFDSRLILEFESPIKEDFDRKLKAAQLAPWALKLDDWRKLQGQEPLPDNRGQVHMAQANIVPVTFPERDENGELIEQEPPEPPEPPEPEPEPGPQVAPPVPALPAPSVQPIRRLRLVYDAVQLRELERALDETLLIGQ